MRLLLIMLAGLVPTGALPAQFPVGHATPVGGYSASLFAEPIWIGNPGYGYRIEGAPPGGSAIIAISSARQDQMVGGLDVYLDLANVFVTHSSPIDATGQVTLPFPLGSTDDPALTGLQLYAQAAVSDPAVPGSVGTTQALLLEITLHPMVAFTTQISTLWLLDPVTGSATSVTGLLPNTTVLDVAFGNAGRDLFVASSNGLYTIDTLAPSPQAISIWPGYWSGVAWDRVHRRAYAVSTLGITVVEGNRAAPGFGSVLVQVSDTSSLNSISLSADGRSMALSSVNHVVTRRDGDPSSPNYLQQIPTPAVPPFGGVSILAPRVHMSPDGRVVSYWVTSQWVMLGPEIHRFDTVTGTWIDHDSATPGIAPLSPASYPALASSSLIFPSQDGSSWVATSNDAISRIELDLDAPANVSVTSTPTPAPPMQTPLPYYALTPSGDFLLRKDASWIGTALSFVHVSTGWVTPWLTIPGPLPFTNAIAIAAWR